MLVTVAIILGILWLFGIIAHIGGALINIVLVVAIVVFLYHLFSGRKAA